MRFFALVVLGSSALAACSGGNGMTGSDASTVDQVVVDARDSGVRPADHVAPDAPPDAPPFVPPATSTACATPTIAAGGSVTGTSYQGVALAWGGTEGALAYLSGAAGTMTPTVSLQRLNLDGTFVGTPVMLGTSTMTGIATVASDGTRYIACWDGAHGVECAAIPTASGDATPGFMSTGTAPSIVFGSGGFLLAYIAAEQAVSAVILQRLAVDGTAMGQSVTGTPIQLLVNPVPALAATTHGFGVSVINANGDWILQRYNSDLSRSGGVNLQGVNFQDTPLTSLTAHGDDLGISWMVQMQVTARTLNGLGAKSNPMRVDATAAGMMPGFGKITSAAGSDGMVIAWSSFDGSMLYRAIADDGTPRGTAPLAVIPTMWDDNPVAIVAVTDGFLAASTVNPASDTIHVVHLACP